jgi:flavin reductase (DIM6/NTAB) family NADH-FMN oxidoreductase RutF
MFYETVKNNHGLPYDPLKAIIAPRPIGWITTMGAKGEINLAPYSFFNAFSTRPPIVGFSSEGRKDSVAFAEETREFVCNLATYDLREAMNVTAGTYERGVNEMREAGLEPAPSRLVKPPRVADSPCALECKFMQTVSLTDLDGREMNRHLVIGVVVGIYIDDSFIKNGLVDTAAMKPIARCGYNEYAVVDAVFSLTHPK